MTCDNCKYWLRMVEQKGVCRRFPATVFKTSPTEFTSSFPPMAANGWCGEYATAETKH